MAPILEPNKVMAAFKGIHRHTAEMRACATCGEQHNRMKNHVTGELASYCHKCQAAYTRSTRKKYSELTPEARMKANCRSVAKMALRRGSLIRQPCRICGGLNAEMHHEDYSKPRDVVWLCRLCHVRYHILCGDYVGEAIVEHSASISLELQQVLDIVKKNVTFKSAVEQSEARCTPGQF